MQTPFQMFGAQQPRAPQSRGIPQAIQQARSFAGDDPEGAVARLTQTNPQVAQLMQGRTPQQACEELARRRGIDLGPIVRMMGGMR